ncbi:hypothetical protein [Aeromonas sp. s11]|uniref:hypothetical protein n=1 Tax=Aeromonas sp. s11 TaxID=3138481 RepID=UPI0034A0F6F5
MIDVKGGVQRQSLSSYKDIQDAYSRRKTFLKELFSQPEPTKERDVTLEYPGQDRERFLSRARGFDRPNRV